MVVVGDAGIGKTRLAEEATRRVLTEEVLALQGTCLPMTEKLPFRPIADLLCLLAEPANSAVLAAVTARVAPYVLPQIGVLVPALGPAAADGRALPSGSRSQLFAAVRELGRALGAQGRRLALIVEDLHWADTSTLDLLTYLTRTGGGTDMVIVATTRLDELPADHPVRDWLNVGERVPGAITIDLGGLDDQEVAQLVRGLVGGTPDPALLANVQRRGEGSPLFTEHLVRAELNDGSRGGEHRGVPRVVASVFATRIRAAGPEGMAIMAVLAVVGRALSEAELASAPGAPLRWARRCVSSAVPGSWRQIPTAATA